MLTEGRQRPMVSTISHTELAELVGRIIAGDRDAEDEMIRRYKDGVFVIINRIVRSQPAAEDLSQEALIIILQKVRRGDVREPERLSGFVCSVARNRAIEYIRKPRDLSCDDEMGNIEFIRDPSPTPFEQVLIKQRDMVVRQLINELKVKRDRDVLFRFYIAEETKEEICNQLGLTSKQFDNVIYRAKERYRELYLKLVGK